MNTTTVAIKPTEILYGVLQRAFDFFNERLWDGKLPQCVITVRGGPRTLGFFRPERLTSGDDKVNEIAINAQHISKRDIEETLSTLVHEMAHHWQQHNGKPGKNGYHNRQWVAEMLRIGLEPFNVKDPTKQTGTGVSHTIVKDGPFQVAFRAFKKHEGKRLKLWGDVELPQVARPRKNRWTYRCPECSQKVLGVQSTKVNCGECDTLMERVG